MASRTSYAGLGRAGTAKNKPRASHINKCGKSFPNKLSFTSPSPGNSYKWIDLVLTNAGPNSAGGGGGGRRAAEENTRGGERKREWGKRYEARRESDEAEWSRRGSSIDGGPSTREEGAREAEEREGASFLDSPGGPLPPRGLGPASVPPAWVTPSPSRMRMGPCKAPLEFARPPRAALSGRHISLFGRSTPASARAQSPGNEMAHE